MFISELRSFKVLGVFSACSLVSACHGGGYDQGPSMGNHAYPPPGDFNKSSSTGPSTQTPKKPEDKAEASCIRERTPWKDWDLPFSGQGLSAQATFARVDHEIKTPLHWSNTPASQGQVSWNVAGQQTHLSVRMSIDPQDDLRSPVFVAQRPANPNQRLGDCPSYWELPVLLNLSTADLALNEKRVPGLLEIGSGGVSRLHASVDSSNLTGDLGWITTPLLDPSSTAALQQVSPRPVKAITLNSWLAKGIMWATIQGQLQDEQTFNLADGNADDPRCQDGQRLKVSLDHPLGQLSARRVLEALQSYEQFEMQWQGQGSTSLRLAALAPPKEVCVNIHSQDGPSAALEMPVRMTFVDDEQHRSLTVTPNARASLNLGGKGAIALDLRYNAFSRAQESLSDFLARHALTLSSLQAPSSGIFEFALTLRNDAQEELQGSVSLTHFAQNQDCSAPKPDSTDSSQCGSLHGTTLRTGTLVGQHKDLSK